MYMQLKETSFLIFEQNNGRENTYLQAAHNLFINYVYFSGKQNLQPVLLVFWWPLQLQTIHTGPYC